jgi:hypothetical protein
MAIDPALVDKVNGDMLVGMSEGYRRRADHADAVANEALSDVRALGQRQRTDFDAIANLILNQITSDQTGKDDVINERVLTGRVAQFQPQEGTYADPNYRPGASPPSAPPVAAAGK